MSSPARRADLVGLWFVLPFLSLYTLILIWPLFRGIGLSFHRADLFGAKAFVGLDNYARLVADPIFWQSVVNTFILVLLTVPLLTALALALAIALNKRTRASALFRGIFFAPAVLSVTIVTLIWRFILTPDAGLVAEAAQALGREPVPFLSDPGLVLPALALTTIWWSLGFPMMLFLAGLQQIPEDMYEAAALDGAGPWTRFWRITLPSLRRTLVLVLMTQVAAQLQLFDQAQLLSAGGPSGASRTVVLYIFEASFGRWELGYATAMAEMLFLLVLLVTVVQYRATSEREASR